MLLVCHQLVLQGYELRPKTLGLVLSSFDFDLAPPIARAAAAIIHQNWAGYNTPVRQNLANQEALLVAVARPAT